MLFWLERVQQEAARAGGGTGPSSMPFSSLGMQSLPPNRSPCDPGYASSGPFALVLGYPDVLIAHVQAALCIS